MIPCPDKETIISYAEGRLSKKEAQEFQTHLSLCAKCREISEITRKRKEF